MGWRWFGYVLWVFATTGITGWPAEAVRVWEEPLVLPTYVPDAPDVNPMFRRPLSYQGASRVFYPYPAQEGFSSKKEPQTYRALYLENEYIKVCVLPELGGRLFYATDKTNGYELFYRQQVIKPAHVGMLGAWISGGIEWCVFHHHRASTYLPVDSRLRANPDGSATIWIGEIEPRHRMKWAIGITLYPGRSSIEATVRMMNTTPAVNSILYWANVATHVNDEYQVIFPPSTRYGVYHAKNDFVHWPIGRGRYRGRDYRGVDVSWWKNHPGNISIFAHDLREGFLAGYDHGRAAGTLLVTNHHVAPGAKLWEWGKGSSWDTRILTDEDGPYAELMAGAYSDNQPDYSWIFPGELKEAIQTWSPLRDLGGVKAATAEASLNLDRTENGRIRLALNTTRDHNEAVVRLRANTKPLLDETVTIGPGHPYRRELDLPAGVPFTSLDAALLDPDGTLLVSYRPTSVEVPDELPAPVRPPPTPQDIQSVEELYLTGLRIRQFHNARRDPGAYFREALERDPGNVRCNIQMGIEAADRWDDAEAIRFFETARARATHDYTRPRDAEALYQLGLVLKRTGRSDEAYQALYRSIWDFAFRAAGYYELAEMDCARADFETALSHLDQSLAVNTQDVRAWTLRASVLRRLGQSRGAKRSLDRARAIDPLCHAAAFERWLLLREAASDRAPTARQACQTLLRDQAESYLEMAATYARCGLWEEAKALLSEATRRDQPGLSDAPLIQYWLAYVHERLGESEDAAAARRCAAACPTDYAFPFRYESLTVLGKAIEHNPSDARAHYYRGNLWYDHQPQRAMRNWERATAMEPALGIAHRNLGWGHLYQDNNLEASAAAYRKAIHHNPNDPRYYFEMDQVLEQLGTPAEERLGILESNLDVVRRHQLALVRAVAAWVQAGRHDAALDALRDYYFHAQEGSEQVHDLFVDAHLLRGLDRLDQGRLTEALEDFQAADTYPGNHQAGRPESYDRDPQIHTLTALCLQRLGRTTQAEDSFRRAVGVSRPDGFYAYYQGLASRELGQEDQANRIFQALLTAGEEALARVEETDYFAKFGEGEPARVRRARAHLMIGLAQRGLGETDAARPALQAAAAANPNNPWAAYYQGQR